MSDKPAMSKPVARDPRANERLYFDVLKRVTNYDSVERLRRDSEKRYGLPFEEALEYAYENVKAEAERAVRGKRRPKEKADAAE